MERNRGRAKNKDGKSKALVKAENITKPFFFIKNADLKKKKKKKKLKQNSKCLLPLRANSSQPIPKLQKFSFAKFYFLLLFSNGLEI